MDKHEAPNECAARDFSDKWEERTKSRLEISAKKARPHEISGCRSYDATKDAYWVEH